jgi:hypothetical protein
LATIPDRLVSRGGENRRKKKKKKKEKNQPDCDCESRMGKRKYIYITWVTTVSEERRSFRSRRAFRRGMFSGKPMRVSQRAMHWCCIGSEKYSEEKEGKHQKEEKNY